MPESKPPSAPLDPNEGLLRELEHHIEERVDRLIGQGMTPEQARRTAMARFGDMQKWHSELKTIHSRTSWRARTEGVVRDIRHAFRQFRRAPGFAALAVLTLALGIGSSTAMFGVVKAVVWDPLPFPDADRLFELFEVTPDGSQFSVADANFLDFARVAAFEQLAASSRADLAFMGQTGPLNLIANQVTPSFFNVFGGDAQLGRTFNESEGGADPARVAVLSHGFWRSHFGDTNPVDQVVVLDNIPFSVVGVMPEGWAPLADPDLWVPLDVSPTSGRSGHWLQVVGRLAPGTSLDRATQEVEAMALALGQDHPETNENWTVRLVSLKESVVGADRIRGGWILMGAVGLLLMLACGSVANLLIARASTRIREMAVRSAIGAAPGRLIQQLLVEGLTLAAMAAVVGLGFAFLAIPAIQAVSPPDTPRIDQARVSGAVAAFSIGVALLTGLLFGLAPALRRRGAGASALRSGSRTTGRSGERLRRGLVAGQVAATVTLLFGAGLLASSFLRIQGTDIGMRLAGTSTVPLMMSGDRYTDRERQAATTRMREQIEAIPGVEWAGVSNVRPFSGSSTAIDLAIEGAPSSPEDAQFVRWRLAGAGYFAAAGLELVTGRLFESHDFAEDAEDVVVVTRSLATEFFGDVESALGRRIAMGWDGTNWQRIVGVIPDVEDLRIGTEPPLTFFMPDRGGWPWVIFLVRSENPQVSPNAQAIREAIWSVDAGLPVPVVEPLRASRDASVAGPRFNLALMSVFGTVALLLSIMGVYGVTQFAVSRRTQEIGVRLALGAEPKSVVRLLLRQGFGLALIGVVGGIAMAIWLSRFVESLLFQTAPTDPTSAVGAAGVTFLAVMLATWIPALRAANIEPTSALAAD